MAKDTHGLRLVKAATGNGRFRLRARLWTMGWIQPVDKPLVRGPPGRCPAWFASARTRNATSRLAISPSRPPIGSPAPREWKRCRGPANAREEAATGQRAAGGGPLSSRCRPGRRHQDKRSMSRASPQCGQRESRALTSGQGRKNNARHVGPAGRYSTQMDLPQRQ